jgi:excisionase family DNA binding protein
MVVNRALDLLDIAEAAALLRVSEASLRRWTNTGLLPCLRIGGRRERRFRRADLLAFVERQSPGGTGEHLCGLYADEPGRLRHAAAFLAEGLQAGSVCVLAAMPDVRDELIAHLTRAQPGLKRDLASGRFVTGEYNGAWAAQLQYWERQFEDAAKPGGGSLRVIGDVSGGLLGERNRFEDVIAYEVAYAQLSQRYGVSTLCLYDARRHSGLEAVALLQAHPDVFRHPVARLAN